MGTSICDNALRMNSKPSATGKLGASAASTRQTLAGMCVNTIVFSSPMRLATQGAANCDAALSNPDQKKKAPACDNESPN